MGLETVKEEIIRDAQEQARILNAEARKETSRIIKEAERKIEGIKEKSDAELKVRVETIKKQELASAKLENKKVLLEAKIQLIESVFIEVKKRIEGLDTKKREIYMKKLLEKTKNDIEAANVYCNKKDLKFLNDFKAESIDIIGGLIAENKDRTIKVDYSFDTMLDTVKEKELQNINKILFG